MALFVAGEAYPTDPVVAGEAKLGALCSIMVSVLAVGIGTCLDLSPEAVESPAEAEKRKRLDIAAGTGGEEGLLANARKRTLSESSDDECLETVFAMNAMKRLSSITRSIKTVEKETHVSRQEAMSVFRKHVRPRRHDPGIWTVAHTRVCLSVSALCAALTRADYMHAMCSTLCPRLSGW